MAARLARASSRLAAGAPQPGLGALLRAVPIGQLITLPGGAPKAGRLPALPALGQRAAAQALLLASAAR